jgi:hypothetical protein
MEDSSPMFFVLPRIATPLSVTLALWLLSGAPLVAALTGPTLHLDYGAGEPMTNPLGKFMYFVPLISPEQVSVLTNSGNTQCARVTSFQCHTNGNSFHTVCEFDFVGEGLQRNVFDHTFIVKKREKDLKSGKVLAHQLTSINVEGAGSGFLEIDGMTTNGQQEITVIKLRFNNHGRTSPVSVNLQDIALRNGSLYYLNEIVARVNTLTFRQKSGPPKMEVSLASVKSADAGNGIWENFIGGLKGAAANFLLPPLSITTNGQQAMMDFGRALATEQPTFTFPFADRLTNGPPIKL